MSVADWRRTRIVEWVEKAIRRMVEEAICVRRTGADQCIDPKYDFALNPLMHDKAATNF